MNLMTFLNRGAALSGIHARVIQDRREKMESHDAYQLAAMEECRQLWLSALLTDQTRAWMSLTEEDGKVLTGLATLLTAAAVSKMFDDAGDMTSPEVNVIRGAISAITQCANAGCVVDVDTAKAIDSGCTHAKSIFETCSMGAIKHAALQMHSLVRQSKAGVQ